MYTGGTKLKKILLTGSSGFVGGNVYPILSKKYHVCAPTRTDLDLKNTNQVREYLKRENFDVIIHFASPSPVRSKQFDKYETLFEDSLKIFMNFYSMQDYFGKMLYSGSGAEYDKTREISLVTEDEIGKYIPSDSYGFSKYVINALANKSQNIYNMRIFACYGPHEYDYKFITHAIRCCLEDKPITIRQDCYFDYLYIDDYTKFLLYFIENKPLFHDYNVSSGKRILLSTIAEIVKKEMQNPYPIEIFAEGLNKEYTASNARIVYETAISKLTSIEDGIHQLIQSINII